MNHVSVIINFEKELENYISRKGIYPTDCVINNALCDEIEKYCEFYTLIEDDSRYKQRLCGVTLHRGDGEQLIYFYKK